MVMIAPKPPTYALAPPFTALGRGEEQTHLKARRFFEQGIVFSQQKKYQEALEAFEVALRYEERVLAIWYNTGVAL